MENASVNFQKLFESVPGLYLVLSPDLKIVAVSNAYAQATMTKREELIGKNLFNAFPDNPDEIGATGTSNLRASLKRVLEFRKLDIMAVQKYDIRRPESEGGGFEVRYWSPTNSPVFADDGSVALIIHSVKDVTQAQSQTIQYEQIKDDFRNNLENYHHLVETISDYAILFLDPTGKIASWNPGAERIKGYSAKEIIGQHFSIFYSKEDQESKRPDKELVVAREKGRYEEEGWRIKKNGDKFWASVIITPTRDSEGRILGYSKITRDITEKRKHEEALQQKTRELATLNEELEAFSFSVSHDLRAPLRGIDGFCQALLEDYSEKLDDQGKTYLEYVRQGTQKMGRLIDDLLNLSRYSRREMNMTTINLSKMAKDMIARIEREEPNEKRDVTIQPDMQTKGDEGLISAALENLVRNAWKFTKKSSQPKIEIGAEKQEGKNVFYVRDNGAGFDMKYYDKLFGVFQRLHSESEYEGTGVGLATVRRIINRHGGKIWATSQVGQGTTFWFSLP